MIYLFCFGDEFRFCVVYYESDELNINNFFVVRYWIFDLVGQSIGDQFVSSNILYVGIIDFGLDGSFNGLVVLVGGSYFDLDGDGDPDCI